MSRSTKGKNHRLVEVRGYSKRLPCCCREWWQHSLNHTVLKQGPQRRAMVGNWRLFYWKGHKTAHLAKWLGCSQPPQQLEEGSRLENSCYWDLCLWLWCTAWSNTVQEYQRQALPAKASPIPRPEALTQALPTKVSPIPRPGALTQAWGEGSTFKVAMGIHFCLQCVIKTVTQCYFRQTSVNEPNLMTFFEETTCPRGTVKPGARRIKKKMTATLRTLGWEPKFWGTC